MIGGPPCQSFSSGGRRSGLKDPRGNLVYEYLKLIGDIKPKFFVLENVANIVTTALVHRPINQRPGKNWNLSSYSGKQKFTDDDALPLTREEMSGSAIRQILSDVALLGYDVSFGVLNSAEYGAPQRRLRFILMGSRVGKAPNLPTVTHGGDTGRREHTLRDALQGLTVIGEHSEYTAPMRRMFELIPPGGNWRSLPEEIKPLAMGASYDAGGGKTGFYRRLSWDEPSPTITGRANRKASAICHPDETRPLSVRECARVQGFPDSWIFSGSMSQQYLQIGNAVPVALGKAIGVSILNRESNDSRHPSYDVMLQNAVRKLRSSAQNKKSRVHLTFNNQLDLI